MSTASLIRPILAISGIAAVFAFSAGSAYAQGHKDSTWQQNHPRREQVNQRLANQNRRINNELASGDINQAQASQLHHEDHQIRQEERLMASPNNGHITRQEQKTLNQQENQVSPTIGK